MRLEDGFRRFASGRSFTTDGILPSMTAIAALVRDNPGLLAMFVLLVIGTLVLGSLAIVLWRSGASLRPIVFVGGMMTLVWLPQFAYHVGVATGAIPRRNLTWMPAADQASVYG